MNDLINFTRAITRPMLTFAGWFCLCNMVYEGKEVPEFFIGAVLGMTGWWFADRSWRKRHKEGNTTTTETNKTA